MRSWTLPAGATVFGLGVLVVRASDPGPAVGPLLLASGMAVLGVATAGGGKRAERSRRLLEAAALMPEPPERGGPRDRILAAAGFPTGEARRPVNRSGAGRVGAALAGVALLGAGWSGVRGSLTVGLGKLDGRYVRFLGTASSDVRRFDTGWGVEVRAEDVLVDGSWLHLDVRLWLTGYSRPPGVEAGQALSGAGSLRGLHRDSASGFESYLLDRGIVGRLSASELRVRGPPANPALRMANAARRALRRGANEVLSDRQAGLLLGLTVGDTSSMDPEVDEDFRATGLGHLLAVSGSNVAMFLAPVLALAGLFRLRPWLRFAVGGLAVGFFVLLTRWEPSVLRAGAMAALALVGVWAGRPRSTGALLGASVLLLLVADPNLAASLGFQLSVAATAGLAVMAAPMATRLGLLPKPIALAAAATLAAQAAVTPLLLLHFGVVPTVTLLANVLAFPAVAAALFGGTLAAGVALASEPLGHAIAPLGSLPLSYLIGVADKMARFPLPSITGTGFLVPAVATALTVLLAWRLRRGRRPIGVLISLVVATALAWSSAPTAGPPNGLSVTFIDVGQGDAALVRAPDGATVLIDAGPDEQQVATELAAMGVRRIDLAVASHAHADHTEGFAAVLARFPVALLIEPGCHVHSPSYERFLEAVDDEEVPVRHPRGGQRIAVGRLVVEVLGPDTCFPDDNPNNDSLVLRVRYKGASVLFPGDAEVPAQEDLLADGDPVQAAVLKVPHHGGDTSDPEFFEAVGAEVAVVSTGPNDYGHPVPSVLTALAAAGMRVIRTDLAGDVTVRFTARGVLIESEMAW